jgi:AmmeMemoRadiSam system protein B
MSSVRPAAVAGTFYPGGTQSLRHDVDNMLRQVAAMPGPLPKAVIVPHAGYIYSGPIAASAYQRIAAGRDVITRVVLLGPAHRVPVRGLALPQADAFETPLGVVPVDTDAEQAIRDLPQVVGSAPAHAWEHSLEVQLPFLQATLGGFKLVPLVVGDATAEEVAEVLERLWGAQETLIVISSDLSHYLPYELAKKVDSQTARMILGLQVGVSHEQACGGTPVNGLLLAAKRHHLAPELLDLRNSGDTAGDADHVVGYAAFAFVEADRHAH